MHDTVIVGASHAGLSAALVLARAGRRVLVIDNGSPRNPGPNPAHAFHTRDGQHNTAELLAIAHEQLANYPHVTLEQGEVHRVTRNHHGFLVSIDEREAACRKLVLATGVRDVLPPITGLAELWGTLAVRCPYCDGWELRDADLAVIGSGEETLQHLGFLRIWSKALTLYTHGDTPPETRSTQLSDMDVHVIDSPIESIARTDDGRAAITADGQRSTYRGIFLWPKLEFRNTLARQLGCALQDGGAVVVDGDTCETTAPGVYAIGDLIEPEKHMVALAVATGLRAAFAINTALLEMPGADGAS